VEQEGAKVTYYKIIIYPYLQLLSLSYLISISCYFDVVL